MKPGLITYLSILLTLCSDQVVAQDDREIFSKGYQSSQQDLDRFADGTWVLFSIDARDPYAVYSDTLTAYHVDSAGQILHSIVLTPPREFENFTIENILALQDGSFLAVYSGGDCDAGGYAYYAEKRDTTGQLQWVVELPMVYYSITYGAGLDNHILVVSQKSVTKFSALDGSILWEVEYNSNLSSLAVIVPGTEDLLITDITGLKYFKQVNEGGEISYQLQASSPTENTMGYLDKLFTDHEGTHYYGYQYNGHKVWRFKSDLQPELYATLDDYPIDIDATYGGVYYIIYEHSNSRKLIFIDSVGNDTLFFYYTNFGIRPERLKSFSNGIGLIGEYGSGSTVPVLPEFKYNDRSQTWFKYYPQFNFETASDTVDLAISQIIQQSLIHYSTYWSAEPFPANLNDFFGGNFKVQVINRGNKSVHSFWINIAFGSNVNTWWCPATSAKQILVEDLELVPGDSVWVEFGDIYAINQQAIPDQYCFWTSGPNHLPDYFPDNDAYCMDRIVAVHDVVANSFSLFPNPVDDQLNVQWDENSFHGTTWSISDLFGRVLKLGKRDAYNETQIIQMDDLPAGLYAFTSGSFSKLIFVQHN